MIILGVDIGLAKLGICSINISDKPFKKLDIKYMTTFKLNGKIEKQNKMSAFLWEHTETIARRIREADLVVIEKPFGLKGYANVLFELFGIIKFICIINQIKFVEISPMTLKKFATGKGNAQKSDMVLKAYKEFKVEGSSEDEIDALWCALAGDCLSFKNKYTKNRSNSLIKLKIEYHLPIM